MKEGKSQKNFKISIRAKILTGMIACVLIVTNLTGGEDDNTSVIPVKDYKMSTITITSISTIIGGLAASIFIPVVLIIIGVVIWAVRRKK